MRLQHSQAFEIPYSPIRSSSETPKACECCRSMFGRTISSSYFRFSLRALIRAKKIAAPGLRLTCTQQGKIQGLLVELMIAHESVQPPSKICLMYTLPHSAKALNVCTF